MDGGDTFECIQWEKPQEADDFRILRRAGEHRMPEDATTLRAAHDGQRLYLRFTARDSRVDAVQAAPRTEGEELWPRGDHIELWLKRGRTRHVFALNVNSSVYDAKELDRDWDSGWRVLTRRVAAGWEAIAVIPMESLGMRPDQRTGWTWYCSREIRHAGRRPIEVSYQGTPLYRKDFPVVIE